MKKKIRNIVWTGILLVVVSIGIVVIISSWPPAMAGVLDPSKDSHFDKKEDGEHINHLLTETNQIKLLFTTLLEKHPTPSQ